MSLVEIDQTTGTIIVSFDIPDHDPNAVEFLDATTHLWQHLKGERPTSAVWDILLDDASDGPALDSRAAIPVVIAELGNGIFLLLVEEHTTVALNGEVFTTRFLETAVGATFACQHSHGAKVTHGRVFRMASRESQGLLATIKSWGWLRYLGPSFSTHSTPFATPTPTSHDVSNWNRH